MLPSISPPPQPARLWALHSLVVSLKPYVLMDLRFGHPQRPFRDQEGGCQRQEANVGVQRTAKAARGKQPLVVVVLLVVAKQCIPGLQKHTRSGCHRRAFSSFNLISQVCASLLSSPPAWACTSPANAESDMLSGQREQDSGAAHSDSEESDSVIDVQGSKGL